MNTDLCKRTFEVFSKMNDWLPRETVEGLKAVVLQEADATEFANKVGPANYQHWSRDIRVISETIEILGMVTQ